MRFSNLSLIEWLCLVVLTVGALVVPSLLGNILYLRAPSPPLMYGLAGLVAMAWICLAYALARPFIAKLRGDPRVLTHRGGHV